MPNGTELVSRLNPLGKFNRPLKPSTHSLGVTPSFERVSHTHTLDTGWYRIGLPTKSLGKIELFSETMHKNTRRNTVFLKVSRTHTFLDTGWYNYGFQLKARGI